MTPSGGVDGDDDEQLAEDGLDLSPLGPSGPGGSRAGTTAGGRRRRWGPIVVLALVLVAGGVVITQFLGNALDYYCNADEVGVTRDCSGDRSLRIQGTVARGSVVELPTETRFTISFNGRSIPVVYDGDPGGKFQECIPVVVRGRMQGSTFEGNQVEVKHSNEYAEKNSDRIDDASAACPAA